MATGPVALYTVVAVAPSVLFWCALKVPDALLVQACREVEVDHRLDELPEGFDRGIERLRVENSLAERGLSVS
ncbi:hypothetical protein GCM10027598_40460 [Amycolatopsis oliviviridis]|uniref:Uncharacterized protein n=1 Tax=Amycolatopsis oliviviridis TaxID=1471590 RepID=A0ABQ3LKW5_9PSEU|nr:hypothetical protein [Amycolatopsis oliviviridis]GHH11297.1 hypothetical protein GCM10017790_21380 [Amycolatopsis oliviviridis]